MPIQPIDHLMMVPRNQEASQVRQQEVARPPQEQSFFSAQVERQAEQQMQRTVRADGTEYKEERYDAREKGKGKYEQRQGKKKKQEEDKSAGKRPGEGGGVLDIKI